MQYRESHLYWTIGLFLLFAALIGVVGQGSASTLEGFIAIQVHPARLLNDYTQVGGEGAAVLNAALVAAMGLGLVAVFRVRLSGPTIAAVFTIFGFGLFGKTPINVLPIIIGVWIAAKVADKSFEEYILIALFGTALGPLVTAVAVEAGLPIGVALPAATLGGLLAGIILPSVAISMLRLHQGFNLYNIGLTCGFLGLFAASVLVASGRSPAAPPVWNVSPAPLLQLLVPVLSVILIVLGCAGEPRRVLSEWIGLMKESGRLPSDFVTLTSTEASLLNTGVMGLLCWGYTLAVGGPLNGPILGGIFTAMGFATFGKHPRNSWSIMVGVVIACLVFGKDLAAPGPLLAALFGLTLAPLAGEFGWGVGLLAGFLHLVLVERTGAWHLGVNLYNNGFSGGLTATLLVAVIEWFRSNKPRSWQPEREREPVEAGKDGL